MIDVKYIRELKNKKPMCLTIIVETKESKRRKNKFNNEVKALMRRLKPYMPKPKTAKKDIIVYKQIMFNSSEGKYYSAHYNKFEYPVKKVVTEPKFGQFDLERIAQDRIRRKNQDIDNEGLYGFRHPIDLMVYAGLRGQRKKQQKYNPMEEALRIETKDGFYSYNAETAAKKNSCVNSQFIIPKGAKYFLVDGEYMSDKIMLVKFQDKILETVSLK